jgi:hypothetical protein
MPVSFERDIRPMSRQIDIDNMNKHKVLLDIHTYMSNPAITATHKRSSTV